MAEQKEHQKKGASKTAMAFGTFDILHKGHLYFLEHASKHGMLIVVVARDANVMKFKGRAPKHDEQHRLAELKKLPFIDSAVLGNKQGIFRVVESYKPDIICLGYDQKDFSLEQELKKRGIKAKIMRIGAFEPEKYKSSKLRTASP